MAKHEQPSLFGDAEPPAGVGAYGRRPKRPDPVTPVAEAIKAHEAINDVPPWMPTPVPTPKSSDVVPASPPPGFEPAAFPAGLARASTIAYVPPVNAQHAIDRAGVDLVADLDAAIAYIRDGRGIVAIKILEAARAAARKGSAS